jgi:hypothetical protein
VDPKSKRRNGDKKDFKGDKKDLMGRGPSCPSFGSLRRNWNFVPRGTLAT